MAERPWMSEEAFEALVAARRALEKHLAETEAALRACAASLRGIAKWAEPPAYLPDAGVWALYRADKEAAGAALALPAVRRVMEGSDA